MFTDFESLKLERESRRLDRQIDKLMAVQEGFRELCEVIDYKSESWIIIDKKYWENSAKLDVLFKVQENIEKLIENK